MPATKDPTQATVEANDVGVRRTATLLMHRRINTLSSGSGAHLLFLCSCLTECNYDIRIVLAPVTSFGRIPFCRPDPVFAQRGIVLDWPGTIKLGTTFFSVRPAVWQRALQRLGVSLAAKVSRLFGGTRKAFPSALGTILRTAEADDVLGVVNATPSDLVIAEYSSLAPLLGGCKTGRRAVLLHDLFSSRNVSFQKAGLEPDHFALSEEEECARLVDAELCIHSSHVEAKLLEQRLPRLHHIWMRPIIRCNRGEKTPAQRVVFIGADHGGNRDALDLILNEIWPAVRRHVPHELWIVGAISTWVKGQPEQVRCVGFLEDLRALGNENTIGIAPMRAASGISIKIGTYLELGMRVVTFRQTVEAYGDTLDDLVVTVDTTEAFAAMLIKMLLHPEDQSVRTQEEFEALQSRMCNKALLDFLRAPSGPDRTRP